MSLKQEIEWAPRENNMSSIKPITLNSDGDILLDADVNVADDIKLGGETETSIKAKRFVDLVQSGEKPGVAAVRVGTTLKAINNSEDMKKAVRTLVAAGNLSADVRREVLRAGLNIAFVSNIDSPDTEAVKIALSAAKQMAQDPQLEMQTPVTPSVVIDLGALGTVLSNIKMELAPEIEATKEEKE